MNARNGNPQHTSVLIVGGGPAGLLTSILLSRLEIDHTLIERRSGPQPAPAAHVINTRTMEILRCAGINTADFYALNKHDEAEFVSWVTGPRNKAIGKFPFMGDEERQTKRFAASPEHITNISQNLFERALGERTADQVVRYGHSWQEFIEGDTHRARVLDEKGDAYEITADFILAADGAASGIARSLGITKIRQEALATFLNISCEVDLSALAAQQHSLLYWCLSPNTPGILIVHDPKRLTVYMRPVFEPFESIDDYDDERCEAILRELFGPDVPVKVAFKGTWQMTAQVAERFSSDNVFLIGDSAHRFPPTGGLGLNSGAGDVHNLIWKIAAHLQHGAPAELLASYEAERKPVAQHYCDTSTQNFQKMTEVTDVLGLDAGKAHIPARLRSSLLFRFLPKPLVDAVLQRLTRPVVRKVQAAYADTPAGDALRRRVQSAIDNQAEHFDMLGAELGYVYRQGCAVDEQARSTPENTVRDYTPTAAAGARLPHVEIAQQGKTLSTLDLVTYGAYTLFVNGPTDFAPTSTMTFGLPCTTFDIQDTDSTAALAAAFNLQPGGWILVRPDAHVANRQ
ncbi:2,4-dichlorophenol 6-monooxygenase [Halioglobus japonicus]|nr:2,4-dichlorophenol 6-monooxygenase [Halioglobus japonicus]